MPARLGLGGGMDVVVLRVVLRSVSEVALPPANAALWVVSTFVFALDTTVTFPIHCVHTTVLSVGCSPLGQSFFSFCGWFEVRPAQCGVTG